MIEIQCVHTMSLQCTMYTCLGCTITSTCPPTHWAASLRWGISFIISTHGCWAVITYINRKVKGKCANDMMPSYPPKQQDRENELTVYMTSWNMTQKVLLVPIFYIVAERKNTKLRECFLVKWSALLLTVKSPPSLSLCPEHQGISNWNLNLQRKPVTKISSCAWPCINLFSYIGWFNRA